MQVFFLSMKYEDQVQEKELQKFLGLDFSMHEWYYRDSNGKEPGLSQGITGMQRKN